VDLNLKDEQTELAAKNSSTSSKFALIGIVPPNNAMNNELKSLIEQGLLGMKFNAGANLQVSGS